MNMDQDKWNKVLDECLALTECEECGIPLEEDELQYCKKCWKKVSRQVVDESIASVFQDIVKKGENR